MSKIGQIYGAAEQIFLLLSSGGSFSHCENSVLKLLTSITCSAQLNPSDFIMRQVNETHLGPTFYYSGLSTVHVRARMESN